jgi:hypothetical protein
VSKKSELKDKSLTFDICDSYANGKTFTDISKKKGLHREQVKREVIKGLKWFLENYEEPEEEEKDEKCIHAKTGFIS